MNRTASKFLCIALSFLVSFALFSGTAKAADKDIEARIEALEAKVKTIDEEGKKTDAAQDEKLEKFNESTMVVDEYFLHREKGLQDIEFAGVKMSVGGTFILQGTPNINSNRFAFDNEAVNPSFSGDLRFERPFVGFNGNIFFHLEGGLGDGIERELDLYSGLNYDTDNEPRVRITELWYEQMFFSGKLAFKFGMMDPTIYFDGNRAANDETVQFLGDMFRNNPAIDIIGNNLGVIISAKPLNWLLLQYGLYNAANDWNDLGNHLFNVGQINIIPVLGEDLKGNYRLIGWSNGMHHTKWNNLASTDNTNYGFAVSIDQLVTKDLMLFVRYGWQVPKLFNPNKVSVDNNNFSINQSWSGGASLHGAIWGRKEDVVGLGVGQIIPSFDYRKTMGVKAKNELHLEAYYKVTLNKHLSITPDFQFVWQPFGTDTLNGMSKIFVGGARLQVDF